MDLPNLPNMEEYFSGLTPQQQKMLKQGLASTKELGENVYGFVPEVEKEDGQKSIEIIPDKNR